MRASSGPHRAAHAARSAHNTAPDSASNGSHAAAAASASAKALEALASQLEDRVARLNKLVLNGWDDRDQDEQIGWPNECVRYVTNYDGPTASLDAGLGEGTTLAIGQRILANRMINHPSVGDVVVSRLIYLVEPAADPLVASFFAAGPTVPAAQRPHIHLSYINPTGFGLP